MISASRFKKGLVLKRLKDFGSLLLVFLCGDIGL